MAKREDIARFLNKELKVRTIKDSSRNGFQVKGISDVKKIAFAVDACMETFEKAKIQGCDMIIVHHGLLWRKDKYPKKTLQKRINFLKKGGISLYAAHLPLDAHKKYGNNAELCRILGVKNLKPFGKYHGFAIGFIGQIKNPVNAKRIADILNRKINTKCSYFDFTKKKNKTIGIISGGGAYGLPEGIAKNIDCFVTGEQNHSSYHFAKENNINLVFAGHYATETLGVKALMPVLERKFGIETVFIDVPTGL